MITEYSRPVEEAMRYTFSTLNERQRRLFAASEALKLGYGGIAYIAQLLDCHRRTIERGLRGPGSKRGNKSPIDSPFLERLFPPCCGWLNRRTPFHGGNRHGLPGYFVRLGHAM